MSVILFSKNEVYKTMTNSFEDLKHLLRYRSWDDGRFYTALRRLYFANVATFLCQYHDNSPLHTDELSSIDTFTDFAGKRTFTRPMQESALDLLAAWNSLKYNLVTNDGEHYKAQDSYEFMEMLALWFCREVLEREGNHS